MKIIKNGEYPKQNKITCKKCGCEFQYYNSEVIVDMPTPDEEAFFGGFSVYKYIECPCCKGNCEISYEFIPHTSRLKEFIKKWFKGDK